jgi:hypothetical protein
MCNIPDFQSASNARIIPRKPKKHLLNSDISFLGFPFYEILTFEKKFDNFHLALCSGFSLDCNLWSQSPVLRLNKSQKGGSIYGDSKG